MSKEADRLLDLRNYVTTDIDCWRDESVKLALNDVVKKIDETLKELK